MSALHTPGPWEICETQKGEIGIAADGIWIIAVRHGALYHPRGDANARLIAAAPELLDALSKAVKWLAICDDPRCEKDLLAAEEAILNARGEAS